MQTTLSDRFKIALADTPGKTQAGLAAACRISRPSVNGWVKGTTKTLEGQNLLHAAAYLGVNPKWLAEGVGPKRAGAAQDMRVEDEGATNGKSQRRSEKPLSDRATAIARRLDKLPEATFARAYALLDLTLRTLEAESKAKPRSPKA